MRSGGETGPATRHRDTLRESESVVALFRTLLVAMVLIAPTAIGATDTSPLFYLFVGLAGLYCFAVAIVLAKRLDLPGRQELQLVLDSLLVGGLLHFAGGIQSGAFPLFYLTVIIGAMWFSMPGAVWAAALATLLGLAVTLANASADEPGHLFQLLRYDLLPQVLMLFLAAILCAYLAEAWHAERRQADDQRQIVQQFRKQMDMARELQSLILPPQLPTVRGLDVGVRTRPAAVVVGGDYYDAVDLGDGRLGVCCADVSGKSVPGQLRLPLVKYALRVCALQWREAQPVIERLNRLLYGELPPEMFVSLVYAVIDPAAGRAALAGKHCPPLHVISRTGEIREVPLQGVVLGLEPEFRYPATELELAPDDYLILYSDGAIEARGRRGEELGVPGLIKLVAEATPESAQDLANWLFSALEEHEIGEKRDDLTVVVIHRGPATSASPS